MDKNLLKFIEEFENAHKANAFFKLLLSKPVLERDLPVKIQIRNVLIKSQNMLSFVLEYPTKSITKNYAVAESVIQIQEWLTGKFKNAVLFTRDHDIRLSFDEKFASKLEYLKASSSGAVSVAHNREKKRMITIENNIYLQALGLVTQNNHLLPSMQAKFKQINKYIETIDGVIKNSSLANQTEIHIADMGAGKGYLTFALYDYLNQVLKLKAHVAGVELRPELVKMGNELAQECAFERLKFYEGEIKSYPIKKIDMLIALHACDTATDDAIARGIFANAAIIITAPCCHKQIRKAMHVTNSLKPITQFGILEERQAEIVTDTLRALVLEAHGYKTQVFEFISDAHTHKNVMIVGVKKSGAFERESFIEKINNLKQMFGIEDFYLESLL